MVDLGAAEAARADPCGGRAQGAHGHRRLDAPIPDTSRTVRHFLVDANVTIWHHARMPSCTAPPLEDRLRDAQYDHDDERRESVQAAVANELGADNDLWVCLGGAIADLARLIRRS